IHAYRDADWLGQTLYALCLPGTVAALVFPDWTYYPPIHFITIEGFLFHFGVVAYVVFQLISGRIRPSLRVLWKVLVFLAVAVPPIYFFNKHFHTNYFFVNVPSPGSPLEWFMQAFGDPGWLLGYAALVLVIMLMMELLGGIRRK
ncbi:MAG: YwaF family protein, partial [Firmicutes bacterium]|nr:YwaF family protein [Bacillota bacterium]